LSKSFENAFEIAQDVVVPEPYDVITRFFQPAGPRNIRGGTFGMLSAIDLDNQIQLERDEIDDAAGDRLLPLERDAQETPITTLAPDQLLGIRHLARKRTRSLAHLRDPSPHPLPNGERAKPFPVAYSRPIIY